MALLWGMGAAWCAAANLEPSHAHHRRRLSPDEPCSPISSKNTLEQVPAVQICDVTNLLGRGSISTRVS
jgi:hypothetical protein